MASSSTTTPSPEHFLLLGTFRHPLLYTLSFNTQTRKLTLLETTKAFGGHSWLHLNEQKDRLYCTVWGDGAPCVAAYKINQSSDSSASSKAVPNSNISYPVPEFLETVEIPYLSGYVTSNSTTLFSASGPKCDVIDLDAQGGFMGFVRQSVSFVEDDGEKTKDDGSQMDFGGLRNGGHSADISPDGTKLYVADIGRNAVHMYKINNPNTSTSTLTLLHKYRSRRSNDGPRHCWPHPNGKVVYCVQEHSSYVDVLELVDEKLVWRQGAKILPDDQDCHDFWADEVRTSPGSTPNWLFGSTRGLKPSHKGYVTAYPLLESGFISTPSSSTYENKASDEDDIIPTYSYQTPSSGGWANAIAACPTLGSGGDIFLTLTDSELGSLSVLGFKEGFEEVDRFTIENDENGGVVGASVAVWF